VYIILRQTEKVDKDGQFTRQNMRDWLDPVTYPDDWHDFILSMMTSEDIRLCLPLRSVTDRWLIPAALSSKAPDYGKWPEFRFCADPLRFRYRYKPMPHDLMVRFICEAYDRLTDQPTLWAGGAVMQVAGCRVLVTANAERELVDILVDGCDTPTRRRDAHKSAKPLHNR
ncbi:MAG: COR domain-containing protein, partial [Alphaproteobacteria bacterium]